MRVGGGMGPPVGGTFYHFSLCWGAGAAGIPG